MIDFKGKRIMVVAAHPDDELLGIGATMHDMIKRYGVIAHCVILGEGITSRSDSYDRQKWEEALRIHHENMSKAASLIGYQTEKAYSFADNRFDTHDLLDIVKVVEKEKAGFKPDYIFTHNGGDLNIDHQLTFQAVMTACRPMEDENVKGIFTFETPSATEWQSPSDPRHFLPNFWYEISEDDLDAKCNAMSCYEFETRLFPHPRSNKALRILAEYRGLTVGMKMAEAFQIIRLSARR